MAACHSCGRGVNLESYDTRLWFVIFFIPIIPLGRKRIIDQCPLCKRHFVADADKWETQKQLNVSGAMEEYLADPTPEKAMNAHQQLILFHQTAQAADFRREIAEKYRQHAKLQAYLGQSLLGRGMIQDSTVYFQRALELRPDLPEARVGVAREHMRAGRLDEARALLDFLEKPGAGQLYSLEPLETLANAYQQAGKRQEALDLFHCLFKELPDIGQITSFRKRVRACEKMLGRKESILPKRKFSLKRFFWGDRQQQRQPGSIRLTWRGLAIAVGVIAIFATLIAVHGVYQRHHRPLFIVNGMKDAATVEIRDEETVHVGGNRGEAKVELAEGRHHVSITGPVRQELDIDIQAEGSPSDPAWVLNIGGAALLAEKHVTYAVNPPPPKVIPHFGKVFERIDGVSHPFGELPASLQMRSGETRVLTNLGFSELGVNQLLPWLQLHGQTTDCARLAEWQLTRNPSDGQALEAFVAMATPKHVEEFLQAGLQRRPVDLRWHRAYQNLHEGAAWYDWMNTIYGGMVKADPKNSALLYLQGRVATNPTEGDKLFEQARDADPQNPFPYFALAYNHVCTADWEGARPLLARSVEIDGKDANFAEAFFINRLALKEYGGLEKELRAVVAKAPGDFSAKTKLIMVLLAQGRRTDAAQIITATQSWIHQARDPEAEAVMNALQEIYLYVAGDFATLAQTASKDRTPSGRASLFMAQIEQGKIPEALRVYSLDKKSKPEDAFELFSVSLAWFAAHDSQQANDWAQRAVHLLQAGSPDAVLAASLFAKDAALTPETIDAVRMDAKAKAILLTTLGNFREDARGLLFAKARALNVDPRFPYHLLRRTTGDGK